MSLRKRTAEDTAREVSELKLKLQAGHGPKEERFGDVFDEVSGIYKDEDHEPKRRKGRPRKPLEEDS